MPKPAPLPELPDSEWFRAVHFHPAHPGYYKVRQVGRLSPRHRASLLGSSRRFWDGAAWLPHSGGKVSIFGTHDSHEWCGQRRWVLAYQGGTYFAVEVRRAGARWTRSSVRARPFLSESSARRFAARYPRLALVPVLA